MSDPIASVSSLSTTGSVQATSTNPFKKIREDMQQIATALQSGDLGSAQTAFATLQKDAPNLTRESQNSDTTNPRAQALADLGSALQSGNLTQAQQAFSSLQQAMKAGGHHHHHGGSASESSSGYTTSSSTGSSTATAASLLDPTQSASS